MTDWDCASGLPFYQAAVDWENNGMQETAALISSNPYTLADVSNWVGDSATVAWEQRTVDGVTVACGSVTPDGVSSGGGVHLAVSGPGTIDPAAVYISEMWVNSDTAWSDVTAAFDWYDNTGAYLSTSIGDSVTLPAGGWTRVQYRWIPPSNADRASARMIYTGTPPSSQVFHVFGLMLLGVSTSVPINLPGPSDMVLQDVLDSGFSCAYGRDQYRQTTPGALGTGSLSLKNVSRRYTPDNPNSPLFGNADAARTYVHQVVWNGTVYPVFRGRIDDYTVHASRDNRTVDWTFQDEAGTFESTPVTTDVWTAIRTGDAISNVLDIAGWSGPRDLDPGDTVIPYWWVSNQLAGDAINDLVMSEGPPAIFYMAPDGTATFRSRSHRLLRTASIESQASFYGAAYQEGPDDCAASPAPSGALSFVDSMEYQHGWRDIINSVTFPVTTYAQASEESVVWQAGGPIVLQDGQELRLNITTSDAFVGMQLPDPDQGDYTTTGPGSVSFTLFGDSGQTLILILDAFGQVTVNDLRLRATVLTPLDTITVSDSDSESINQHGEQDYPQGAPWAYPEDAAAIATLVLARYAQRRPTVTMEIPAKDPDHYLQVLTRTISDRITIRNDELGVDADFIVEHVAHAVQRMNAPGRPPVHSVILGCERDTLTVSTPFMFDTAGAGFDQGMFGATAPGDPSTVFVFDDPVRGQFDFGRAGT